MAITSQQQSNIIALTVGMFNAAPGAQNLSDFASIFENNGQSYHGLADAMASTSQYQSQFDGVETVDGRIDKVLANLGIQAGTDAYTSAKAHFDARVAQGASETQLIVESLEYLLGDDIAEEFTEVQAQLNNRVDVATYYSVDRELSSDSLAELQGVVGNVTADPETVEAAKEAIGSGEPTPEPEVPTDTIDVTFNTSTVGNSEEIFGTFETTTDGELVQIALPSEAVRNQQQTVTAIGKAEWDAAGRPVTTSADYTFNMANQLGAAKEYEGLFLSPLLTSESRSTNSQLFIELLDIRAAGTAEPLGNLPIDGIRFQVDGEPVVLRSDAIFEAKTYPELLEAIREAIADDSDLAGFTAEIGSSFTATDGGQPIPGAVGDAIVLTDAQGREITNGSFTYSDQETGGFTLYGDLSTEAPESIRELISTNLDLDNVGYGSQGGSINLAGESNTDKGVEEFNVDAENGVWLTRLESETPSGKHALKEINLEGNGYFRVGQQSDYNVYNIAQLLQQQFKLTQEAQNVNVNADAVELSELTGLVDVEKFNGQQFDGEIKLNAYISDDVIGRDLNAQDDQADATADNVNYTYRTANGDDQISLIINEEVLEREDALLNINAGNGNNTVETIIVNSGENTPATPVDVVNQQLNQNFGPEQVTIVTGSGDDTVRTWGAGDATIKTGAGNDVIYADNSGLLNLDTGESKEGTVWEFNSTADAADTAPTGVSNSNVGLSNGVDTLVGQTFVNTFKLQVQVSFKGFESVWVDVPHSVDELTKLNQTTALEINQAIKDAVNNDAVLKNLIEANDGNGNILNIESLIDGQNATDLNIEFRGPLQPGVANPANRPQLTQAEVDDGLTGVPGLGTAADTDSINGIYSYTSGAGNGNADVYAAGGNSSLVESDNDINAGSGHDVIVLGTGAESNDTVKIDGVFDRNSIVNFESGDATTPGYDILDFTSFFNGHSAEYNVGYANGRNVEVENYGDGSYARDGVNWANLNAADVAARFNEDANVTASTTTATNSILLVQDGGGTGQYKAFHLSSAANSEDFNVNLLGIMDFGETQTFDAANFA